MSSLAGQVALVTGAARRVGAAVATALARRGAQVGLHYHRSSSAAHALAAALQASGACVLPLQADLCAADAIPRLVADLTRGLGPATLLVNSAAVYEPLPLEALDAAAWDRSLALNLRAPALLLRALLPGMRAAGGGAVVNLGDLSALQAWPGRAQHAASKAGLVALTRSLASELHPAVRVNALLPGLVLPAAGEDPTRWAELVARVPQGRSATPDEVAEAVCFLLETPALSGWVLPLDGGRSAGRASS